MGALEIILIIVAVLVVLFAFIKIFSSKKKKKAKEGREKKEKKTKGLRWFSSKKKADFEQNKKIEKVYKKEEESVLVEEKEKVLEKDPPKEKIPFKIIRKQSQVKISKKALKSGSRNPSVSRVFDNKGNMIEEELKKDEVLLEGEEEIREAIVESNEGVMSGIHSQNVERFGVREEYIYDIAHKHFELGESDSGPRRKPIIEDRTNFGSHLTVSEDGNLSGVIGTGVSKILEKTEEKVEDVDRQTEDMLENIRRNVLGSMAMRDSFNFSSRDNFEEKKVSSKTVSLKDFDAKTLLIAEAVNNPKNKKVKK